MASGAAKHCAVKAMLKETVDTDVPATVLNLHDDVVLRHQRIEPRMPCILKISCLFGLSS